MIGAAYNVSVLDFPRPVLRNTTDAIVRVTAAAICGSDLHFYHEASGSPSEPFALGHEAIGYIDEIGSGVQSLSVGQYVIVPDNADDGHYTLGPDLPYSFGSNEALGGCQGMLWLSRKLMHRNPIFNICQCSRVRPSPLCRLHAHPRPSQRQHQHRDPLRLPPYS